MTTNQTIDGVPRELLENAANYMEGSASALVNIWCRELRALLDAPDVKPRPFGYWLTPKTCAGLAMFQRELIEDPVLTESVAEYFHVTPLYDAPAAQPQGEPVKPYGYMFHPDGKKEEEFFIYDAPKERVPDHRGEYWTATPLYVEQPAPVAVVMPERSKAVASANVSAKQAYALGWNACLDELRRLNP